MSQLQFIRQIMYRLKRRYGAKIEYYTTTQEIDELLGRVNTTRQMFVVRRAIRLPNREIRDRDSELQRVNFTFGGNFDKNTRNFILDLKDLPKGFTPSIQHYIITDGKRYNIKEVTDADFGFLIIAEYIESEPLRRLFDAKLKDTLTLNSGITHD